MSHDRRARHKERAFVIEGPTLVDLALDAGLELEVIFVADDAAAHMPDRAVAGGVPVHEVTATTLARALDTTTPQGIAAVAPLCDTSLAAALAREFVLVLVGVGDPGNAGTLVRTAEAAGAGAVVFCASSVDPFAPKVVRASAGSLFQVAIVHGGDPVQVLEQAGASGHHRLATSSGSGDDYVEVDLTRPIALALGSEAHGLPPEIAPAIDQWVRIPMAGRAESLNVAMAGAVLCFERARQRRARAEA